MPRAEQQFAGSPNAGKGFPTDIQVFSLEGETQQDVGIAINTKAQRPAIGDQQAGWIENYLPIGGANTRALYGVDTAIVTDTNIINFAFYNIASDTYCIDFLQDGSAKQTKLSDLTTTAVGTAGTFFAVGNVCTPTIVQWAASGILIVSKVSTDAYWAWDGTTLFSPGDASPDWLNGGTPTTMPTGVAGSDIEIFLSRAWIVDNTNILTSVASNGADFSTFTGGLTKPNTDSTLRVRYTGIMALNGYLYVFGDSSCAYITNVQTSTLAVTTYQYTVIDAQIGTPWRDSIIPFGRSILFGNVNGVYALYGSSANKISASLDGIWDATKADFTTVVPSSSVATLFGIKTFMITIRTKDPTQNPPQGTTRTLLAMFDGQKWFMGSQVPAPTLLAPQEVNSELSAYGSDGATIRQLFNVASDTLQKKIVSKLWGGAYGFIMEKQILRFYTEIQPLNGFSVELNVQYDTDNGTIPGVLTFNQNITFINNSGETLQFQNNSFADLFFQSAASISINDANGSGLLLGFTLTSTSPDYVFERAAIGYKDLTALY